MLKIYQILSFLFIFFAGCTSTNVDKYAISNAHLSAEILFAMQNRNIVNGMEKEQVKLVLGEPDFIEEKSSEKNTLEKWIYRFQKKTKIDRGKIISDSYDLEGSSFPQGIGHIIPMSYDSKETRIEFDGNQVCKVQKIIAF
ncbi:MAG: hypothetical protein HUU50_09740 [Candidatus Brocadiae bacterium]|nr:hypothetical protein [Candidatus Brocadiia bacterium]